MPTKHDDLSFMLYTENGKIYKADEPIQELAADDVVPYDYYVPPALSSNAHVFTLPTERTSAKKGLEINVTIKRKDLRKLKNEIRHWFAHVKREERRYKRRKEKLRRAELKEGMR